MRFFQIVIYGILFLGLVPLAGCHHRDETAVVPETNQLQALRPTSHRELEDFFASKNYDWNTVPDGVPLFILETLPGDLHRVDKITEKKRIFFLSLLPMVLLANDEILAERQHLEKILDKFDREGEISAEEMDQLGGLQKEYGVEGDTLHDPDLRTDLLGRIDVIPPSLVLAQAATESAYGTSRFARRANNIFGEWTFVPGAGLVPRERPEGETYEVRRFPTVAASLYSYMKNINTNRAYRGFRHQRAQLRAAGRPLRGLDLAAGLERYSIRGLEYVDELRQIIRRNRLTRLSAAALRSGADGKGLLSSCYFSHRCRLAADETRAD
jgi:Bax protein